VKTRFHYVKRLGDCPGAALLGLIAAASLALSSCGSSGSPAYGPNLSAISVSFSQAPASPMLTSSQSMLVATVSNDSANMGVDWHVSCASTKCGSFSPAHTASGAPTAFTAPSSVPPTDDRINITAVSTANPTSTVTATVMLTDGISVSFVQPPPASLQEGGTVSLSATVTNDTQGLGINWTAVGCGSSVCGTFNPLNTSSGVPTVYTAPSTTGAVTIIATAAADTSKYATAVINITAPPISVTLAQPPASSSLAPGATLALTAIVANDPTNAGVDWAASCKSSSCGSFSPAHTASGAPTVYTAPVSVPTGGTVNITATSTADKTKVLKIPITITTAPPGITIAFTASGSPPAFLQTSATANLSATVSNDSTNAGVNWTVSCTPATGTMSCGSFSPPHTESGAPTVYTAPASVPASGSVTIIAASAADPAKTVSAIVTIKAPTPVSITFCGASSSVCPQTTPPTSLLTSQQAPVAADVQNDPNNPGLGVDWTVTCQSAVAECGNFNPTHTASDVQTTYTAPASVPTGGTVTITATATADPTKSVSQPVTITSAGITSLLKGQYAFSFTGLDINGFTAAAGSITADGFGNITAGEEDFYDAITQQPQVSLVGSYTIGSDGRGTMTLTPNAAIGVCSSPSSCTQTLSFVVVSPQHALIIAFDGSATSSGSVDLQNSNNFSLSSIAGAYSFAFSGLDISKSPAVPLAVGGVLSADGNGNFTSVTEDMNDGGAVTVNVSTSGMYNCTGAPDSFGRGTAAFGPCATATTTFVYYVVNSGTVRFIETDAVGFTAGSAFAQGTGPFSNASLSGPFAFTLAGKSSTGALVAGGLFTSNGKGNIASGILDVNNAGSVTNGTPSGKYGLASNGRGTLTFSSTGGLSQFGIYVTSNPSSPILLVELDSGLTTSGAALAQASGVSASTLSGDYGVNFDAAITGGKEDLVGQMFADGASALGGNADLNQFVSSGTPTPNTALAGAFTAASNGRFTGSLATSPTGNLNEIFYVASNSTVLFIETDAVGSVSGPATGVLQLQQFSQQFAIPIFAAFSPLPPTSVVIGAQAMFTALIANDSTNAGVDWTVTCPSSACGSVSPAHTASGAPTTFTAPAATPTGGSVTITAAAHADSTKTVTATVNIGAAVSIAFTSAGAPPSTMQISAMAPVSATVSNDPQNLGVNWTVSCTAAAGTIDCGSFSPTHTASGNTTTYTAPASIPSSGSVTITATAAANAAATASDTVTITGPPPSITVLVAPPSSMQTGTQAMISADVQNDPKNLGVNWTVTCGSTDCGSFNPTHTASDAETVYTAPASVPASGSVTIIATTAATPAATAAQQVTITGVGSETGLLNGQYAFYVTGTDNGQQPPNFYAIVGSITADGNGNITAGEEDFWDLTQPSEVFVQGMTGTYTIGADGRGTVTLNTGESILGEAGVQTFSVAVVSSQRALITEFDSSATSSGSLDVQTASNFSLSSISGGYSFLFSGLDTSNFPTTAPLNVGGVLTADANGNFTSVTEDLNDGGTVTQNVSTSGAYNSNGPPDSFGRGTANIGSSTFVYYIVSSEILRFLESDLNALTAGSLFAQGTGPLSNASLSGSFAFTLAGKDSTSAALAAGGLFTSNGSGSVTAASVDVNDAGTVTSGTPSGTYTVGANGRGSLTFTSATGGVSQLGLYLTPSLPGLTSGQMGALLLDLDSGLTASGTALAQASSISASTFSGHYSGNFQGAIQNGEQDVVGQVVSDGASSLTGTADVNQFTETTSTLAPDDALSGALTAASDGRFAGTLETSATGTLSEIFYVVNSSTALFLETDAIAATSGPASGLLQLQQFPSTADIQQRLRRVRRVVRTPVNAQPRMTIAPVDNPGQP
jgi:hypothetical protein